MKDFIDKSIKEFRKLFKGEIMKDRYEGSYMLVTPYEEMVHYHEKKLQEAIEYGRENKTPLTATETMIEQLSKDSDRIIRIIKQQERQEVIRDFKQSAIKALEEEYNKKNKEHYDLTVHTKIFSIADINKIIKEL